MSSNLKINFMFIVYKTDAGHSYSSRDIIGICTSQQMGIEVVKAKVKKEGETLSKDQLWNLQNIKQTQGYSGDGEFQIEEIEVDTLL